VLRGRSLIFLFETDAGGPALLLTSGRVVQVIDEEGTWSPSEARAIASTPARCFPNRVKSGGSVAGMGTSDRRPSVWS
jgi:hypothetical protein